MRVVAGLLAILLAVGCSDKDKVPSGIIPRDEMEKILWDMVQADQYSALYLLKDSARINVKMETMKLYQEVFLLHQVSREEFRKSFRYYQEHPELTRNVFDSLLSRGNRLRAESYSRPMLTAPKPATAPAAAPPITAPVFPKPVVTPPRNPVTGGRLPVITPGKAMTMPGKPMPDPTAGKVMVPNPVTGKPEMREKPAMKPGRSPGEHKPPTGDTTRGKQPK
ncbi:MAG TPA: DUF4296 domain-containing protein [Puia sp.]|nr:DUF4296 domain-containing protein [Puia sp.]